VPEPAPGTPITCDQLKEAEELARQLGGLEKARDALPASADAQEEQDARLPFCDDGFPRAVDAAYDALIRRAFFRVRFQRPVHPVTAAGRDREPVPQADGWYEQRA
jgi:hypothetical protein